MVESTKISTVQNVYIIVASPIFLALGIAHFTEGKYFNFVCMSVGKFQM